MVKVLFVHNTIPEYRVDFWRELGKFHELSLLIIDGEQEKKIYGLKKNLENLDIQYWKTLTRRNRLDLFNTADIIIMPPADNIVCFMVCLSIILSRKKNQALIYWTEKWEAPLIKQPYIKKIKNFVQRKMIFLLCSKSKICIASGSKSREYLLKIGVPYNKVVVALDSSTSPIINEKIDLHKKYNIPSSKKIILFLGRFISRKGCYELIKVCSKEYLKEIGAVLLMCGTGIEESRLKKLSEGNDEIIFVGKIQPNQRKNYYEQSDLFVLPSKIESGIIEAWGLTVNESLECGTPVVVTDAVGSGYDLINNKNGKIIKSDNIYEELKIAIKKCLDNDYEKRIIKEDARKYSVYNMANKFSTAINLAYDRRL